MSRYNPFLIAVLAGGAGVRLGGGKPHRLLAGVPLIVHVIARVRPDVLCGGPDLAAYGLPVLPDGAAGQGPLAGILAAMGAAEARGLPAVLTVPCDTPFLPEDLIARFAAATPPALAVAGGREQPAVALWPVTWRGRLAAHLGQPGRRALLPWLGDAARLDWPDGDFRNINTEDDLRLAEQHLLSHLPSGR